MTKIYIFDEINTFNNKESIAFLINFVILYLYGTLIIYIFSNFYFLLKTRASIYSKFILFFLFNLFKIYYF
jgi:biotin transporter BioY